MRGKTRRPAGFDPRKTGRISSGSPLPPRSVELPVDIPHRHERVSPVGARPHRL